jgi:hypothetical protein
MAFQFQVKCSELDPTICNLFFRPHHFVLVCLHSLTNTKFQNFETIVEIVQKEILFRNHFTQTLIFVLSCSSTINLNVLKHSNA